MKKSFLYFTFFIVMITAGFSSCKKSDFDENYYNPEGAVNANVGSLYAGMFDNNRVLPRYWNLYTFHIPMLGRYSQTSGYTNASRVYEQAVNYTQDYWNDYYTQVIARYREVEKTYNNLKTEEEKKGYLLFLETARIFVYDRTAMMVDMYGAVPFNEAGMLNSAGTITPPAYDQGKDLYTFFLSDLKRISDYLSTAAPGDFYLNQLKKFDILNGGNIDLWKKYANSLRLRLAMRMSYADENAAKSVAQEVLSNPTKYPLIDANSDNIQIEIVNGLSRADDIREGFEVNPFAPAVMVDNVMAPSKDPRLPVYFTANKRGEYRGVPNSWTSARVSDSITANYFSRYDSVTFSENNKFPGLLITASEVSFLKAEAFERWGGGDAKAAYEQGIRQSIGYYYSINSNSTLATSDKAPSDAEIGAFLGDPIITYAGTTQQKLEKIATQKWINFNVIQADQAWAEWRRTKLPVLSFPNDPSSTLSPNVPNRLLYPSSERILNATNYDVVKSGDIVSAKVFWDVK